MEWYDVHVSNDISKMALVFFNVTGYKYKQKVIIELLQVVNSIS